jgi:hypothetical protein
MKYLLKYIFKLQTKMSEIYVYTVQRTGVRWMVYEVGGREEVVDSGSPILSYNDWLE